MKEIWKDIHNYEGLYQISNYGRVKSLERKVKNTKSSYRIVKEKILSCNKCSNGYYYIILYKNQNKKTYRIHRLVADAFIPNNDNLLEVNHIDENKENNNVNNLEWCNHKYNMNYGTSIKRNAEKHKKQVIQYTKNNEIIKEYSSLKEASDKIGIDSSSIMRCCKGKQKTCGGYIWKYKEASSGLERRCI